MLHGDCNAVGLPMFYPAGVFARVDEQKLAHVEEQKLGESCEATYTSSPCRSFECSCGGPFRDIYIYISTKVYLFACVGVAVWAFPFLFKII